MKNKIECRYCKRDTSKRIVIKRLPLLKLNIELPNGYEEYYCANIVKFLRPFGFDGSINRRGNRSRKYQWSAEECGNHILIKRKSNDNVGIIHYEVGTKDALEYISRITKKPSNQLINSMIKELAKSLKEEDNR